MSAFLGQLGTLVGVALGALGSYLVSSAGERTRWRRQQATRWDDKRGAAYARYAHLLKQTLRAALWLAASNGLKCRAPILSIGDMEAALAKIESERSAAWEDVLLLGDTETIRAARQYTLEALRLERAAHEQPVDPETWSAQLRKVEETRAAFHAAARNDLGVPAQDFVDEMWSWYPTSEPERL
ncbi:hypothetical protein [Dactylosporangium sp. CA-139066]|uniref:hypothetical protein n=1 Tax=Dactylosporangium sp. CA-139066 TaxID=3239930 RepID=UPI003D927B8D